MSSIKSTKHVLVLPHLKVQNVNTISSPLTWGFPSMTAFLGFMWALERNLSKPICITELSEIPTTLSNEITFKSIGVVCHQFTPQVARSGYHYSFNQTRNPLDSKGATRSIAEEGRAHMDITLLLGAEGRFENRDLAEQQIIAREIGMIAERMRLAGGSILPQRNSQAKRNQPALIALEADEDAAIRQFKKLRYMWMPGSSLVLRDDLLQKEHAENLAKDPKINLIDSWLNFAKLSYSSEKIDNQATTTEIEWIPRKRQGWLVPIPVGYCAISPLYAPGIVEAARDDKSHFRFVESIYSIGEWISPHRLNSIDQLLWYGETDEATGIYKCANDFAALDTLN